MKKGNRFFAAALAALMAAGCVLPAPAAEYAEPEIPVESVFSLPMPGASASLAAWVYPAGAPGDVVWTSGDPAVAEVSPDGVVTALAAGTCVIVYETETGGATETEVLVPDAGWMGDADGNGILQANDARTALRFAVGLEKDGAARGLASLCDADCDGAVKAADARLVLRMSVELEEKIPRHVPLYGEPARVEPACEKTGSVTRQCRICGGTAREVLPARGHAFTEKTGDGQNVCAACGKTECQALGHAYETTVTRAPGCTEPGETTDVCVRCRDTVVGTVPAKGHRWKAATCTAAATCAVCGTTAGAALGHSWKPASCSAPKTCTRCGTTEGAALGHDWRSATCTAPWTCARCGAAAGEALGHDWKSATICYAKTCVRCGATEGAPLGEPVGVSEKGYPIARKDGVTYVDDVLIANKTYALPRDYAPGDLTADCRAAFRKMERDASDLGLNLWVSSGYRSYSLQNSLYQRYAAADGYAAADRYSARPGHSEHQTGLAFDLNTITQSFAYTAEGKWVAANCWKYGFILRYPQGKESQTGYMYEPWHLRYLGEEKAAAIYQSGLCLEEYYGVSSAY